MLVCADGFNSTAREILLPEVSPQYAGYVAWRGVAEESRLAPSTRAALEESMLYQVLDEGHILVYAIPDHDGSVAPGRRLINFVWYRNYPSGPSFADVMTDAEGERRTSTVPPGAVRRHHLDELYRTAEEVLAPALADVVHWADDILIQAIFDLECSRIAFDRICLIGDAAFVARPHLAAGQAKACADAWALRDVLAEHHGDVCDTLAGWEPTQLALGREVVGRSREMGHRSQSGQMRVGDPEWKFGLGAVNA